MNIQEIIIKKRDKRELSKEEIDFFVNGYTLGSIQDYHASALIMAIYLNGMSKEETTNLAISMANSGEKLNLADISDLIVDKHSTGGVGDKVTLILMPIIASLGIPVAKMSGRGLGITGGTSDKLESIPGYKTNITTEEFKNNIKEIGISLIGQTEGLAPADKKIYALRDAIGCVDSIPLIASSIMSKKIASGANKLVLEVMCGSGAFMKTTEQGQKLSKQLEAIGNLAGIETRCVLTNMDEPLGRSIGNVLEVIEVTESLRGHIEPDVKEVVCFLGAQVLMLAKKVDNVEDGKTKIAEQIANGKAYEKWIELIKRQGGDIGYIENTNLFNKPKILFKLACEQSGYIKKADARLIGEASVILGAGRVNKEDEIDKEVGIILNKKVGDKVYKQEKIATIYANDERKLEKAIEKLKQAFEITEETIQRPEVILGTT